VPELLVALEWIRKLLTVRIFPAVGLIVNSTYWLAPVVNEFNEKLEP
jgi:hypothetical protein